MTAPSGDPLQSTADGGTVCSMLDGLGSVTVTLDAPGGLASSSAYSVFGQPVDWTDLLGETAMSYAGLPDRAMDNTSRIVALNVVCATSLGLTAFRAFKLVRSAQSGDTGGHWCAGVETAATATAYQIIADSLRLMVSPPGTGPVKYGQAATLVGQLIAWTATYLGTSKTVCRDR